MNFFSKLPQAKRNAGRTTSSLMTLQDHFHHAFDNFFHTWPAIGHTEEWGKDFVPNINLTDGKTSYSVVVEIPGMSEEDVKISFQDNALTIKGEKREETGLNEDESAMRHKEIHYGAFTRTIPFDEEVDDQKIDAKFKNGVLKILLWKTPHDRIKVKNIAITRE